MKHFRGLNYQKIFAFRHQIQPWQGAWKLQKGYLCQTGSYWGPWNSQKGPYILYDADGDSNNWDSGGILGLDSSFTLQIRTSASNFNFKLHTSTLILSFRHNHHLQTTPSNSKLQHPILYQLSASNCNFKASIILLLRQYMTFLTSVCNLSHM